MLFFFIILVIYNYQLMKSPRFYFLCAFLIALILSGCQRYSAPCILISKKYTTNFPEWLTQVNKRLDLVDMYPVDPDSIDYYLMKSSGIIISGGPDVNPSLYGKEDEIGKCEEIDNRRDTLEIRMIRYAMENRVPLLCICRGCQILNVANGGTLIPDIPSDYDTIIIHRGGTSKHWVNISEGTLLYEICQTRGDTVNSYHHQAVDDLAPLFRAVAFAEDSLIEAIELADTSQGLFILGVQWHPEAMEFSDPLSGKIAERFIEETKKARSR
jgi:putative glutamine amidotransferase